MNRWYRFACPAAFVLIVGCATSPLAEPVSRPPASAAPRDEHASAEAPREAAPQPTGALALRDAMTLALAHHPRLRAYTMDIRIAQAEARQAGVWSNPQLDLEVENIAGSDRLSGVDGAETTLSLAQTFPLGGDLARRRERAGLATQLAEWEYEAARLDVLLEVTQRFIEALAADQRLALARQELALAQKTHDVIAQRVEAGAASPVERTRVIVPVITAEVAVARAARQREAAYHRLAVTWGGRDTTFDQVRGELAAIDPPPPPDALVRLINRNPAVARWATQISERIAARRLAEAEAMPDLTGRLGVTHLNEEDAVALVIGVSLPLPLFDQRRGDVRAARLGESAARQRQRDAELRLEAMLSALYAELAGAHDEATALHERALPAATQAFDATRQAFHEGKLTFLDVLDAQRTLFELQQRHLDALTNYHTAAAAIEALIGQPLADLTASLESLAPFIGD